MVTAAERGGAARASNVEASTEICTSAVASARSEQSADILVARKVQRILCAFEDEGRSLEAAFRFFDSGGDGLLGVDEFHRGLADLGAESLRCLSRAQVELLIAECGRTFKDFRMTLGDAGAGQTSDFTHQLVFIGKMPVGRTG